MTNLDDLVRRQAAILAEIEGLDSADLEILANAILPEVAATNADDIARRLLRGLLRTRNVGSGHLSIVRAGTDKPGIIPALPGFFVVDLMALPDGGFDRERVLKEPVIAWKVDSRRYAEPLIPGMPVTDRWAVLTPDGFVMTDECTNLFGEPPLALKDRIKSEIESLEAPEAPTSHFWIASQEAFAHSGPLPRAIWSLMAGRRDWVGTLEEMFEALCRSRDHTDPTGWPSGPAALAADLKELEPILASAGLLFARIDDGRLLISRLAMGEPN